MNLNFTYRKTLLLFLCGIFLSLFTLAQTNNFTGSSGGNWNLPGNWSKVTVPTALDDVVIPDGKDVFINTAAVCKSLTIQGGANSNYVTIEGTNSLLVEGAITFGAISANNKTKSISVGTGSLQAGSVNMPAHGGSGNKSAISVLSGDVTVTGDISMTGNASQNVIESTGPGRYNLGGAISGGDVVMNPASTFNYNGTTAQTVKITGYEYGNLVLNNTSAGGAILQANITPSVVLGDLMVQSGKLNTNGKDITLSASKKFSVEGDAKFTLTGKSEMVSFSGGTGLKTFAPTSTVEFIGEEKDVAMETYGNLVIGGTNKKKLEGNITVEGNLSIIGSEFNIHSGSGSTLIVVKGNLSHTNGTLSINGNAGAGIIQIAGTSEQIYSTAGSAVVDGNIDYIVKNGATLQMATAGTILKGRSFLIENGGTLGIRSPQGITVSGATGNIQTTTRTYGTGASYIYNGTANQVAGNGLTQNTPKDLFIENPNFVVSLSAATKISGNLIIRSGTLNAANNNVTLGGSWLNFGTGFTPGTATVTFDGTGTQNIGGPTKSVFNNVDINKSSGTVALGQDLDVNGELKISQNLHLANYKLTLGAGSPSIKTIGFGGFDYNKMIIADGGGEVRKILPANVAGQSYFFPIGDNTGSTDYSPVNVTFSAGSSVNGYVAVKVTDAKHPNNGHQNSFLTRYWTIQQSGLTGFSAVADFTYVDADVTGTEANIRLGKWDGQGPWIRYGASSINTGDNKLISDPMTSFSDFTGLDFLEVLPINFGSLRGWNINASSNGIEWKVFDETGTSHYEVERMQGSHFVKIGSVEAGNSGRDATYTYTDQQAQSGDNFYRIKGVEFTGEVTYSPVIRIKTGANGASNLKVYPNPVQGNSLSLSLQNMKAGKYQLIITNMQGQRVYNTIINHAGGTSVQSIPVNNLKKGIYRLQINGHDDNRILSFVKE